MTILRPEEVVSGLVQRGVPEHVAQGVVMNFQDESGLNTGIQEHAPISGRGGFGLAQWTGPRRVALEDFARSQGRPIDDTGLQLDFFMAENAGPEAAAWKKVMSAPTAQDAAVTFVNAWERPASEHAANRSAKYSGQAVAPTSPYALKGAQPPSGATPPPMTASAPPAKADPYQTAATTALSGLAAAQAPVLGQGGAAPQMPSVAPLPMNNMPLTVNAGGVDPRDELARAMMRINTGQFWG